MSATSRRVLTIFVSRSGSHRFLSQLEAHAGAEPADVVLHVVGAVGRLVEALDLFHDQPGLGRLGVGDVDRVALVGGNLVEFGGQAAGRQVQAALGEFFFAVAAIGNVVFQNRHPCFDVHSYVFQGMEV